MKSVGLRKEFVNVPRRHISFVHSSQSDRQFPLQSLIDKAAIFFNVDQYERLFRFVVVDA